MSTEREIARVLDDTDELLFVPHNPPLADFLVVTGNDTSLPRAMERLGARILRRPGHTLCLWGFPDGEILMAGAGIVDGQLHWGPKTLPRKPLSHGPGSYVILDLQSPELTINADPLGGHVLYVGAGLVTNRLHLAMKAVRKVDFASALASTHSNHMFCQQFNVADTPVDGVRIAMPGDTIKVASRVVVEVGNPPAEFYTPLTPTEYWNYISLAAKELAENVDSILDSGLPVVCDLTGGQDSRVLLATLIALDRTQDVSFRTQYSEADALVTATVSAHRALELKRADRRIAAALVKRYGGTYSPPPVRIVGRSARTVGENILTRRSQRFGSYHFVTNALLRTATVVHDQPYIRMMGGSGELYRSYYQRFFTAVEADLPFDSTVVGPMLRNTRNPILPTGLLEMSIPLFVDTFSVLPERTVGHRLDSHYRHFRNRYHFGANMSTGASHFVISPLWSPSLLRAASGLPEEDKGMGRVLFDVTRELCEELAYFPHDKPHPISTRSPFHKPSKYDDSPPELKYLDDPKDDRTTAAASPGAVEGASSSILPALCLEIARRSCRELRASKTPFAELCTDSFLDYLENDMAQKPTRIGSWSSRLQGFVDYLRTAAETD